MWLHRLMRNLNSMILQEKSYHKIRFAIIAGECYYKIDENLELLCGHSCGYVGFNLWNIR